jgi:hypothetical protein
MSECDGDLLCRLRDANPFRVSMGHPPVPLIDEAAAEIARLRAELEANRLDEEELIVCRKSAKQWLDRATRAEAALEAADKIAEMYEKAWARADELGAPLSVLEYRALRPKPSAGEGE